MGKNDYSSNSENSGKGSSLENKVRELEGKLEVTENTIAVLEDTVKSYEDPSKKPRVVSRGYIKKELKFQKNNIKINPSTGEIKNPVVEKPAVVKQ